MLFLILIILSLIHWIYLQNEKIKMLHLQLNSVKLNIELYNLNLEFNKNYQEQIKNE
jgi:hypothetical protein